MNCGRSVSATLTQSLGRDRATNCRSANMLRSSSFRFFLVVVALVALSLVLLRIGLFLLDKILRLVHDVIWCQGHQRHSAAKRQATVLLHWHECSTLHGIANVEICKSRALSHSD